MPLRMLNSTITAASASSRLCSPLASASSIASPSILGTTSAERLEATIAVYAPIRYHLCLNAYFISRNSTLMCLPRLS